MIKCMPILSPYSTGVNTALHAGILDPCSLSLPLLYSYNFNYLSKFKISEYLLLLFYYSIIFKYLNLKIIILILVFFNFSNFRYKMADKIIDIDNNDINNDINNIDINDKDINNNDINDKYINNYNSNNNNNDAELELSVDEKLEAIVNNFSSQIDEIKKLQEAICDENANLKSMLLTHVSTIGKLKTTILNNEKQIVALNEFRINSKTTIDLISKRLTSTVNELNNLKKQVSSFKKANDEDNVNKIDTNYSIVQQKRRSSFNYNDIISSTKKAKLEANNIKNELADIPINELEEDIDKIKDDKG